MDMEKMMKRINPAYVEAVRREVNQSPYFRLISMEIRNLGWGECEMVVEVREKHLQPFGMVHGGVCASLIDATAFWAVYSRVPEGLGMTTVELKLNYLEPSSGGTLTSKGRSIRVGKTLCLGEASVENETGAIVAHGTSTMMILRDLRIGGEAGWPRKYLD